MLEAFEVVKNHSDTELPAVTLTFEERQKSRYRTKTNREQELGWFIERGHVLHDGDCLQCKTGELIRVIAADETVSQVNCDDQLLLTRGAYHLGNRHVPLQIGQGFLRYQHDHVLDDMVKGLGMNVECLKLPFQPENGAYHNSGSHNHSHSHSQSDSDHGHHHH